MYASYWQINSNPSMWFHTISYQPSTPSRSQVNYNVVAGFIWKRQLYLFMISFGFMFVALYVRFLSRFIGERDSAENLTMAMGVTEISVEEILKHF
jgi:hypothetical protein